MLRGQHGTKKCNHGRECGTLTVKGKDVGENSDRKTVWRDPSFVALRSVRNRGVGASALGDMQLYERPIAALHSKSSLAGVNR
jgi:hypothetical protein